MNRVEHRSPGYGPAGLAAPQSISWGRMLSMVFALAVSVAMGWRGEPPLADRASAAARHPDAASPIAAAHAAPASAVTESAPIRPAAGAFAATENRQALLHAESPREDELARQVQPASATRTSAVAAKPHAHRRTTVRTSARADFRSRSGPKLNPWGSGYKPLAYATLPRTRAQVRDEYLASREEVAALTGEDSGSVYQARLAARQQTEPPGTAAHVHGRHRTRDHRQGGAIANAGRRGQAASG